MRGLGLGLGLTRRRGPSLAVNPLVADYLSRVALAGGTLTAPRAAAATALIVGWESAGLVEKTVRLVGYATDGLTGLGVPMLNPNDEGGAEDTNSGFVGGDYDPETGLSNVGASKYYDTGLDLFTADVDKETLGLFAWGYGSAPTDALSAFLGAYGLAADATALMMYDITGNPHLNSRIGLNGSPEINHSLPGGFVSALYGTHWTTDGDLAASVGGSIVGSPVAQTAIANAVGSIAVGARNVQGTRGSFLNGTLCAYAIMGGQAGDALTPQNLTDMNALLAAFNTAMGR